MEQADHYVISALVVSLLLDLVEIKLASIHVCRQLQSFKNIGVHVGSTARSLDLVRIFLLYRAKSGLLVGLQIL